MLRLAVTRRTLYLLYLLLCLEIYLHELLHGPLLLDGGVEHIYPQYIVVAQVVEQLDIGIADYLIIRFEIYGEHIVSFMRTPSRPDDSNLVYCLRAYLNIRFP